MAHLLPLLQVPLTLSGSIKDQVTQRAIQSLEKWAALLVSRLATLQESDFFTGVTSVSAGSSKVTASPTTGPVVVDVVPANFTGIPESGVTSLTADLAARPTGSGTSGKVARWTGSTALGNASISDDGSTATVGSFCGTTETPTQLAGTTNNWAIAASTTFVRGSSSTSVIVTGIAGGVAGRVLVVANTGSNDMVFDHENGSSTAGNRFSMPGNVAWTLQGWTTGTSAIIFVYDGTTSRWRMVGYSGKLFPGATFTSSVGVVNGDLTVTNGNFSVDGNATLGDAAGDAQTFKGNTQAGVDGTYFSWDDGANHRVGFTKKSGASPKLTYGNGITFAIAMASTAGIDASSTYTDRLTIDNGGAIVLKGSTQIQAALDMNSHLVNNVTDPSAAQDAATKNYVDTVRGRQIGYQVLTSASGTYTPTTGAKRVRVRMTGGGGGGGGAAGGVNTGAGAGGGCSGAFFEKWIDPGATITGGTFHCGAAGAAGTAGNNPGGNGGDTDIIVNGTTYTAKGGLGGGGSAAFATCNVVAGGSISGSSSAGDIVMHEPGGMGHVQFVTSSNFNRLGGAGGSNPMGGGGKADAGATGAAGSGNGGGGAGGSATGSNVAGGAGTAGLIIVEEYA